MCFQKNDRAGLWNIVRLKHKYIETSYLSVVNNGDWNKNKYNNEHQTMLEKR